MKFTIEIDIEDQYIHEHAEDNNCTFNESCIEITNVCYLGISCIDAMLDRSMGLPMHSDGYVLATEEE
jgi:hypothetical protein